MIERRLQIGEWKVALFFVDKDFDTEKILSVLYDCEAPYDTMLEAKEIMEEGMVNGGFTYSNPEYKYAVVVTGPTTSGAEFIDTLTHELLHLAIEIANGEEASLRGEYPAYVVGDSARELSDVICLLGCIPGR